MAARECDLLCIGGGLGGLAAALRAADAGLEALIVEKSPLIGGVAAYSGGVVWVGNNHLQRQAGLEDSAEDTTRYLRWVARDAGAFDEDLLATFVRRAPEAVEYFGGLGVRFQSTGLGDQYHPDAPGSVSGGRILEATVDGEALGPWRDRCRSSPHFRLLGLTHDEVRRAGGDLVAGEVLAELHRQRRESDFWTWGPGLSAAFAAAALVQRGVPILLEARCIELVQSGDRVSGAVVEVRGEHQEIRARRGVLVATGSYGNAPFAAELEGLPEIFEASPPVLHGDALALVEPTGAARARAGQAFTIFGYESPTERHPGTDVPLHRELSRALGLPHAIVVNRTGRRFGDESFYGFLLRAVKERDAGGAVSQLPVLSHRRQPLSHPLPPRRRRGMAGRPCAGVKPRRSRRRTRCRRRWPHRPSRCLQRRRRGGERPDLRPRHAPLQPAPGGRPEPVAQSEPGLAHRAAVLGSAAEAAGHGHLLHRPADQHRRPGADRGSSPRRRPVRHRQRRRLHRAARLRRRPGQRPRDHLRVPGRNARGCLGRALSADRRGVSRTAAAPARSVRVKAGWRASRR